MKSPASVKTENKNQVANLPSFKKESEVTDDIDKHFYNLYQGAGHNFSGININGSHSLIIQPKLAINQSGDKYEQEADAMADKVMQPLTPKLLRNSASINTLNSNKDEYELMQRKSISSISSQKDGVLSAVNGVLQLPGESLEKETLAVMEPRFGYDFSQVKIHTDSKAAKSAQTVNARAYTVGQDIVFGSSEYNPYSREGQHLLAHELTHVVQQQRGSGSPAPLPNTALEAEASSVADNFSYTNGLISVSGASGYGLSRQPLSLTKSLSPERLSDEELKQEIHLLEEWLEQQATSTPETDMASQSLERLKKENVKRNKAQSAIILKNPPVPVVQGASDKERLINAMSVLQSIQQVGSDLFTVTIGGQTKTLTQKDVDNAYKETKEAISSSLSQTRLMAQNANFSYETQSDIDKKHYVFAPIVKFIGGIKDPGPILLAKVGSSLNLAARAENALAVNNFSQAASLLAESEQAAIQADGMYKMYWSHIVATGEVTITVLEYTQKASFIALGILATIASAGAAAGLTSIVGLELGAGAATATAANVVATAAPIIAEVGGLGMKLHYGDKIEWKEVGQVALNAAYSIILAKYGGRGGEGLTRLVNKTMAQNPTAKSLGQHVITGIVHSVIMGRGGAKIKSGIDFVYAKAMGTDITWGQFIQNAWDHLFELDIEGWLLDIINGAIMGVGHGIGARKAAPPSTPSNSDRESDSNHETESVPPATNKTEPTSQKDNSHEEPTVKTSTPEPSTTIVEKTQIAEPVDKGNISTTIDSPQQAANDNVEIPRERPKLTVIEGGGGETTTARKGHLSDASSKSTDSPEPSKPATQAKPIIVEQEHAQAVGQDILSSSTKEVDRISRLSIVASKKQEKNNDNLSPFNPRNRPSEVSNNLDKYNVEELRLREIESTTTKKNKTSIKEEHQNAVEETTPNELAPYAEEIKKYPNLKKMNEEIDALRLTNPNEAAKKAQLLIEEVEKARRHPLHKLSIDDIETKIKEIVPEPHYTGNEADIVTRAKNEIKEHEESNVANKKVLELFDDVLSGLQSPKVLAEVVYNIFHESVGLISNRAPVKFENIKRNKANEFNVNNVDENGKASITLSSQTEAVINLHEKNNPGKKIDIVSPSHEDSFSNKKNEGGYGFVVKSATKENPKGLLDADIVFNIDPEHGMATHLVHDLQVALSLQNKGINALEFRELLGKMTSPTGAAKPKEATNSAWERLYDTLDTQRLNNPNRLYSVLKQLGLTELQ